MKCWKPVSVLLFALHLPVSANQCEEVCWAGFAICSGAATSRYISCQTTADQIEDLCIVSASYRHDLCHWNNPIPSACDSQLGQDVSRCGEERGIAAQRCGWEYGTAMSSCGSGVGLCISVCPPEE